MSALILSTPPSANRLFGNRPGGGKFTRPEYKRWQSDAGWEYHEQRRRVGKVRGPYTVHIVLSGIGRRGDCDNRIKPTLDLLVKLGVTPDDRLCESATASWDDTGTVPKGKCRVEIRPAQVARQAA